MDRWIVTIIVQKKRESCIVHNDDLSEFYKSFIDERYNSLAEYDRQV